MRTGLRAVVGAAVLAIALSPGRSAGQAYSPAPAPTSRTEVVDLKLTDAARGKDLPIRVRYPAAGEEGGARAQACPLIIFSHGAGGSGSAFASLSATLAARGYVVVHPTHSDSVSLLDRPTRRERGRRLISDPASAVGSVSLPDRSADVRLILDSIDELETLLGQPGLIDRDRIGMAGHSAGALTTQALGGLRFIGRGGRATSSPEPRLDAFALISGQGVNGRAITEDSWAGVGRPWLVITGSEDVSRASDETPETRRHPFEHAPADGTKYLLFLEGARHSSYQGGGLGAVLDGGSPDNADWMVSVTNAGVLAFFDAHLKGEPSAREWLDSGAIRGIEGGVLEFLHK